MNVKDIRVQALEILDRCRLFFLATLEDDKPRVRPMTRIHHDGFRIWTCSHQDTGKVRQIASHQLVEACFLDDSNRQVRVLGRASLITDEAEAARVPIQREKLPMLEDPDYRLLVIEPVEVRMINDWALDYKQIPLE